MKLLSKIALAKLFLHLLKQNAQFWFLQNF